MTEAPANGVIWTKDRDDALRLMLAQKMTTRAIGDVMGLTHSMVARRITAMGMRDELERPPVEPARPNHIAEYKRARRGFIVPEHLEREYYELLKTGIPIAEACVRLGIAPKLETRGE